MNPPLPAGHGAAIPPAGVVGRIGKLAAGAFQLLFVYAVTTHLSEILRVPPTEGAFWVLVAGAFWLVAPAVNLGAIRERTSGTRARWWLIVAFAVFAAGGHAMWGTWWSLPTACFAVAVAVIVHGYMGVSHIASAVLGFPGCELRALAYVVGRARGGTTTFVACPGAWTPLDRMEARLRHRG